MPLFGSKSNEPLDPDLLRILRPDNKHARSRLAKLQATIRHELNPTEKIRVISIGSFGSYGAAVATDRRLLILFDSKAGSIAHDLHQPGLTVEMEARGSDVIVMIHHPDIYTQSVILKDPNPGDYRPVYFKDASDAAALYAAVDSIEEDGAPL